VILGCFIITRIISLIVLLLTLYLPAQRKRNVVLSLAILIKTSRGETYIIDWIRTQNSLYSIRFLLLSLKIIWRWDMEILSKSKSKKRARERERELINEWALFSFLSYFQMQKIIRKREREKSRACAREKQRHQTARITHNCAVYGARLHRGRGYVDKSYLMNVDHKSANVYLLSSRETRYEWGTREGIRNRACNVVLQQSTLVRAIAWRFVLHEIAGWFR